MCLRGRGEGSSATLLAVISDNTPSGAVQGPPARWFRARVTGASMSPTLKRGDQLLVRGVGPHTRVSPGNVVLARFLSRPELLVVKRVRRAVPGGHWVEGDNTFGTDDSRTYGAAVVVGRVVGRLWPRPGRLPPPPRITLP